LNVVDGWPGLRIEAREMSDALGDLMIGARRIAAYS
jgi:hypothetical protein